MKKTVLLMTALSSSVFANQTEYELMQQWLDLESQKGKLELSWQTNQQSLQNQIKLLKEEKAALRALINKAKDARSEVDEKRFELTKQQQQLEENQRLVKAELKNLMQFINRVSPLLPPPIQAQWEDALTTINSTPYSNSEQLEKLLSMFKSATEFNQRIALNNTNMTIPTADGETQMLVSQIYLGLSQAWYVSHDGKHFGIGRVEQHGWQWHHTEQAQQLLGLSSREDFLQSLAQIKSMLNKPTTAAFVNAPLAIAPIEKDLL
ncbi:DUF3450 family protein [Pseudoalteromonas phenolica]|nr:DUF3450 family protein [Pseudoalteromonas phenolica]